MTSGSLSKERKTSNKVITINALPSQVWDVLTTPVLMKRWMMPDVEIDVITDWTIGSPIIIRGTMNGKNFENRGLVLQFEPKKLFDIVISARSQGFRINRKTTPSLGFDCNRVRIKPS